MAWTALAGAAISAFGASKGGAAPSAPLMSDARSGSVSVAGISGVSFPEYPFAGVTNVATGQTINSGLIAEYQAFLLPAVIILGVFYLKSKK